jgi:PAS domain S-box-containing protein
MEDPRAREAEAKARERRRERLEVLAPIFVAVAGSVGSASLWHTLRRSEVQAARSSFELSAAQRMAHVQRERAAVFEQLRSVVALFDSSMEVEEAEFRTFTANALERNPALRAFLWIQRGDAGSERVVFADGPERLHVLSGTELVHAGTRLALEHGSAGELVLSAPLASPALGGPRVFAFLPVFNHEGERVGRLQGHVAAWLDAARLLEFEEPGAGLTDLALRVEDVTDEPVVLAGALHPGAWTFSLGEESLGGRRWLLTSSVPERFLSARTTAGPDLAFALGLLGTTAAVASLRMASSRRRARALVERRSGEVLQSYATLASEADERRHAMREAKESREELRQILDLVPNQIYVKDRHGRMLMANQATAEAYGASVRELCQAAEVDVNVEGAAPGAELEAEQALMKSGTPIVLRAQPFVDSERRRRLLDVTKIPCRMQGVPALLCVATDVTEQRRAEELARSQSLLLSELVRGAPPEEVLGQVLRAAERLVPGLRCSLLFLGHDRRHLVHGLAPSLPEAYSRAIDGLEIGPLAGSCGAAAYTGQRFVVSDVLEHPNWASYRELARRADIRACWSEPVRGSDGTLLGTFAMYYSEPRAPEPYEERLIESMAHLAGLAIERRRLGLPA